MPPKAKQPANGAKADAKPKAAASATTSAAPPDPAESSGKTTNLTKPDATAYHAEQEAFKREIDELQAKLNAVKEKINLAKGGGPGNERRDALKAELDAIRGQQGNNKASRGKTLDQIQTLQANMQNKIKALQAARGKAPFKSVEEVNAQITKLDNLVNSGTMKIVDERKTLQEISSLRRLRKTVESFQAEQDEIEKDRKAIDELRAVLDDPEMKAVSEKYDQIKGELDELKKESDAAYEGRSKLFDQRTELQGKLDDVWARKKAAQADYKAGTDAYWKKVNEDRARRAEKAMKEKKEYEEQKRKAQAQELLEQAKEPAYAADIQDCQTLIDFFTRLSGGNASATEGAAVSLKYGTSTAPKLELRQGGDSMEGFTALKKKGEEENNYFVAKKSKKAAPAKSYGSPAPAPPQPTGETSNASSQQLNIPFGTLSGLMALSIPPPTNVSEVSRVIEDLKTKKAWFQANQDRVTKENIKKAEDAIEKLNKAPASAANETKTEGEAVAA